MISYYQQTEKPLGPSEASRKLKNPFQRAHSEKAKLLQDYHPRQVWREGGKKENELSEEEVDWLITFLNQPHISYTTPGRKDCVRSDVHTRTNFQKKMRKFAQKRYLLWAIR